LTFFEFRKYFGNVRASRTRLDSRKLVPTLIFAKKREKIAKKRVFSRKLGSERVRNEPFTEITENNEKMTFNSSRLDSRKTRSVSKLDSNFGKKFGMQGPSSDPFLGRRHLLLGRRNLCFTMNVINGLPNCVLFCLKGRQLPNVENHCSKLSSSQF